MASSITIYKKNLKKIESKGRDTATKWFGDTSEMEKDPIMFDVELIADNIESYKDNITVSGTFVDVDTKTELMHATIEIKVTYDILSKLSDVYINKLNKLRDILMNISEL